VKFPKGFEFPDVRYLLRRGDKYFADDRHSEHGIPFWVDFGEAFMCRWDSPIDLMRFWRQGDVVDLEIDGRLVKSEAQQ